MQLLCVYKAADSNSTGMYVAYVWLVAREIDTWTIDGDVNADIQELGTSTCG